ncbi:MAG: outer membrane lipoprotein-sorting protein [Candidatus Krumholzibacteriota bacterium]|nr:outer membrane lipoprotein-sorting protein [Candidatus Krumholzibacteriota bacterium]
MKCWKIIFSLMIVSMSIPLPSLALEDISGLEIIQNVYTRPTGSDQEGKLTMTLINSRGEKRMREIKQYIKDFGSEEKKIMFFISPADIRNTSFMNWSYDKEGRDDDQWIYLPALKRVKRISSDSKSDYFMGSDFTYDDLGDRHPSEDTHKLLRQEKVDGEDCYVVESIPKEEGYMYSRTLTWVIKEKWVGLKKEFYDEDGEHLKTLSVKKYEKIKDYWIITNSQMQNVQKDHVTNMLLEDLKIDTGLKDNLFTERMMRRGMY